MGKDYLKEDGSLNIEYLSNLSIGKFMDIAPNLTDEQWNEYVAQLPKRNEPVKPFVKDERFDAGMEERHLRRHLNSLDEDAEQLASMYLEEHPRPEYFLVKLCSSTEDSEGGYYKEMNETEKGLIRKWEEGKKGMSLDEFIRSENKELYDRLVSNRSLYALDRIQNCDLNDMKKYSLCQIRDYRKESDKYHVYNACFPLSDDEFRMLLAERLSRYRGYTMNSVMVHHPDLAQRIMSHLICLTGMEGENANPFMVIFTEIENAFDDIIKHKDDLDIEFRNFLGLSKLIG